MKKKILGKIETEEAIITVTDDTKNDFSFPTEPPTKEQIEIARRDALKIAADLRREKRLEQPWHGFQNQINSLVNKIGKVKRIKNKTERQKGYLHYKSELTKIANIFPEAKERFCLLIKGIDAELELDSLKCKDTKNEDENIKDFRISIDEIDFEIWDRVKIKDVGLKKGFYKNKTLRDTFLRGVREQRAGYEFYRLIKTKTGSTYRTDILKKKT